MKPITLSGLGTFTCEQLEHRRLLAYVNLRVNDPGADQNYDVQSETTTLAWDDNVLVAYNDFELRDEDPQQWTGWSLSGAETGTRLVSNEGLRL